MSDPTGTIRNGHRSSSVGTTPTVLSVTRGALGGTRTPNLLIRRFLYRHPAPFKSVRDLGLVTARYSCESGTSEGCSSPWLPAWLPGADPRPSAFQAGHNPSRHKIFVRLVLSPVAAACRWSLLLLSPLLSAQPRSSGGKLTRTAGPPGPRTGSSAAELRITSVSRALLAGFKARASFRFTGCCWWRPLAVDGGSGASRGHARNA
jgi:hypothetical protein